MADAGPRRPRPRERPRRRDRPRHRGGPAPSAASSPTSSPSAPSPSPSPRPWRRSTSTGKPVLIARAAEAREVLPDALRGRGAKLDVVSLYETVPEQPDPGGRRSERSDADYITFTSASTVRNLVAALGDDLPGGAGVVSIGPVTSEAAREAGLEVHVEAADTTSTAWSRRCWPPPRTDSGRSHGRGSADHLPLRLRARRRVRRRLPRGDPADRAGRPADRPHPRDRPPGDPPRRARARQRAAVLPPRRSPGGRGPGGGRPRGGRSPSTTDGRGALPGRARQRPAVRPPIERFGGAARAIDLCASPFRLEPVSATFHGRDLFAPVAAHLALGARLDEAGEKFEPARADRAWSCPPPSRSRPGRASPTRSIRRRYGNVALDLDPEAGRRARLVAGGRDRAARARRALRGELDSYLRRRRGGRPAALPQRLGPDGPGGQRRQRRRPARPGARRRGRAAPAEVTAFGQPAPPLPAHRLHQRAREGAGDGGRPGRAWSSPPTSRAPGRGRQGRELVRAAGDRRCSTRRCCGPLGRAPAAAAGGAAGGLRGGRVAGPGRDAGSSGRTTSGSTSASWPGVLIESPRRHRRLGGDRRSGSTSPSRRTSSPPSWPGPRPRSSPRACADATVGAAREALERGARPLGGRPAGRGPRRVPRPRRTRGQAGRLGGGMRASSRASTTPATCWWTPIEASGWRWARARSTSPSVGAAVAALVGAGFFADSASPSAASRPSSSGSSASAPLARTRPCRARPRWLTALRLALGAAALLAVPAALARALALAAAAARAGLGEVAEQLARHAGGLAGRAHAGAAQHLLALRGVGDGGGEQRRRQAPVLVARGVNQAAGVAAVGAAGRVDQQAQQALGLGPALHRVLLMQVAGVAGQAPDPGLGLVAAADAPLGQRLQQHPGARAAVVARPGADGVDRVVEGLGVAQRRDLGQRLDPQLRVAVALHAGQQEAAAQLLGGVVLQHRLGAAPARGVDAGAGEGGPYVLLGVVEVLDRDPPQLALEHPQALVGDVGDRAPRASRRAPAARGRGARARPRSRRRGRRRGRAGCAG